MTTIPKASVPPMHVLYATALLICLAFIFVVTTPARPSFKWLDLQHVGLQNGKLHLQGAASECYSSRLSGESTTAVELYISAILDRNDKSFERLTCPPTSPGRYDRLRRHPAAHSAQKERTKKHYFFALNLYQCAPILPRLLGSIIEAFRVLDPETCVLSVVGSRSDDSTTEILTRLRPHLKATVVTYYFGTSPINLLEPGHDRITELASLRNLTLGPLIHQPAHYVADNTIVVFLNDVAICPDDILELFYQYTLRCADLVCAMDWKDDGQVFYDSWVSRGKNGDLVVEMPQPGAWDFVRNTFWNDPASKAGLDAKLPIQVYACWNGATIFTAKPLLEHKDPLSTCGSHGYGCTAVIPSVNLADSDEQGRVVKEVQVYTVDSVNVNVVVDVDDSNIEESERD
ncbi:hypothetical protein PV08_11426 [Exophiala spinifera]|uniref:Alpha-1,3-mannosyltransferase CMT1 n=1 Tax=Exophiala spinifera TaxID=91928 RepID=A0A0D1ZBU9_9EURO|nr:uncharacterized protein PV08_11426 [Exophiala spinifera]KIW10462.1 hypothetical protein PV08_11426 [Exophiala spinifera]